jgi:hypothetical protein
MGVACGSGFESMHESNLRFEHCYRLDMDDKIAPSHREYCWRDWTETFASDQPLDRIEYARRRVAALESGDGRLVTLGTTEQRETRVFDEFAAPTNAPMAAPAPTSAHEPPPKTAPAPDPKGPAQVAGSRPGEACTGPCESSLSDCSRQCEAKKVDCAVCREDYRGCMRRCFE